MSDAVAELPSKLSILDDEEDVVNALERRLVRWGFEVTRFIPDSPDLDSALDQVMSISEACLCDHDLRGGHQVDFSGAEFVAAATEHRFPSVLFTGVLPAERYEIRRNMARIPALLTRERLHKLPIKRALLESVGEVMEGHRPDRRRGRRTPVTIQSSRKTGSERLVDGLVAGWPGPSSVAIPVDLLAEPWRDEPHRAVGFTFFATINISEEDPDRLFFEEFEAEPAEVDQLLTPE